MQASIDNPRDENVVLKDEISNLRRDIATFETKYGPSNMLSPDEVINEAQSRLVKSDNVIVYYVIVSK